MEAEWVNIGDIHQEKLRNLFPKHGGLKYQYQALKHVLDYTVSKGVKNVVQLGDIYENPDPDQKTQARFAKVLGKYSDLNINMIGGNHDWEDVDVNSLELFQAYSDLGALKHVKLHVAPTLDDIEGVPVCYLSYPHKKVPKDAGPRVVFAHLEFGGALRDSGMEIPLGDGVKPPSDSSDDFWIVGHLHTYQRIGKRAIYPGTMLQLNFGERLPKGFVHTRAEFRKGKLRVENEFVPYETPYELHNVQVKSKDDLKLIKPSNRLFYKLIFHRKVDVDLNWFVDHPNVIKHEGANKKVKKDKAGKVVASESIYDPKDNLRPFLKEFGLKKKQIKIAFKEVDKGMKAAS